ncbi:hypothetical protein SAMN05428642_10440 [Flaviramulus basaltis]|uniref:Uncharacterized protein n=1 Tax=Flaviramulus basaltis TaxID=369401 RepID=A0A1K2IRD1_9FLAO|nr:hypothetical protein [Flaviramulus basaltis]SFZ94275.1 hypothetical protein SAMN05428642_10440 [Flaviramulus basaltis]
MKKLIYIILGFIIGAALTYYFCPREKIDMCEILVKVPKDTITVVEATKLSDNWAKYNKTDIDSLIDVEGPRKKTRSVLWSLDEVNEYLVYAKAQSDSLGYTMSGVRVYLGNYGKNATPPRKNRNTMFIVPTGNKKTSKASSVNLFLQTPPYNIPVPPLNRGTGGDGGYPE